MPRDPLVEPLLPHVLFGDTVTNPPFIECHVLFEWPLTVVMVG
jgi:hypothetical protein